MQMPTSAPKACPPTKPLKFNPKPLNPQTPIQNIAETLQINKKIAAIMEKLKEVVMELLKAQPNAPLSEPHKAHIVEERLNQILPLLHSPDHPPYAWMIERALQELNEKGGSSEESISNFIKKEYDDLPWAHDTMLKHHLMQLCASGEVIVTCDKRYLLAGDDSDLKIRRKCGRKPVKRKGRAWKRSKQQGRVTQKKNMVKNENVEKLFDNDKFLSSQRKDQVTSKVVVEKDERMVEGAEQQELKGDDVELLLRQPKTQGTSNELHEEEGCMIQGIEQQNLVDECSKDTDILCVAEEKGFDFNSDALPAVAPSIPEGMNDFKISTVPQKASEEPAAQLADIFSQNAQLKLGGIHLEDNQMEVSSPERPPGFESAILEEVSHVHPLTAVSPKLPIHPEQLNQHDELDFLDDGKASASGLCVIEDSIPTDRMQRQVKHWSKRLSGVKAPLISDILPSLGLQDGSPSKSEISGDDKLQGKHHMPVESTLITDVKGKFSQDRKVHVALSATLQQSDSEMLSKLSSLDRHPAEPKHHIKPSKNKRKQVAQGTQIRRVLRPRTPKPEPQLFNAITKANFSSSHDLLERNILESECPVTEVTNELKFSIHQNKQDLFSEGAECEPSKGPTQGKSLPKHHDKTQQQIGPRRRGRPPRSRDPAKVDPDALAVEDITPLIDQNQQHNEHPPWPPAEKLDVTTEGISLPKSVHDPHLEQQLEKPRHRGRGRPSKHRRGASSMEESSLQPKKTKYRGRGRPRMTDER